MTEKSIELTKDDFEVIRASLSVIENMDEDPYYILIHADKYENQKQRIQQILEALQEYPKIGSYLERVSTANKIISEKIDEIKKLKEYQKKLDLKFRNDIIETMRLRDYVKQIKQRIEERLKKEESKDHSPECMGCEICYLKTELQQLLQDKTK